MDEIDWIKHTKKAIIVMAKGISIFIGIFVILGLLLMLRDGITEYNLMIITIFIGIGISIILFLVLAFGILYVIYKIMYGGQKKIVLDKEYIRETCEEYTPAIASLVYDLKVDVYKDYTATMLHLYNKGYLNIFENNKICKIEINKEKDFSDLEGYERYVIDCLNNEEKFDENIFKEILINNAQTDGLLTDKKENKIIRITILILISVLTLLASYFVNKILFYIVFVIICSIVFTLCFVKNLINKGELEKIVDTLYKRTKKR